MIAVAYKRFVDNVPITIDRTLLRGVKVGLESGLFNGLDITESEGYKRFRLFLSEPEDVFARRNKLQKKYNRMAKAKRNYCRHLNDDADKRFHPVTF